MFNQIINCFNVSITMWHSLEIKILSTKWFKKWAKKANLNNESLFVALRNLEDGLSSPSLGDHLFKIRVKREHNGKSSGFRTIVAYQKHNKAIFLYGFGKNERDNIETVELKYFKKLGHALLALNDDELKEFISQKILLDLEVMK